MSNKTKPRASSRASAARAAQSRAASRRIVLAIVGGAIAVVAIIAIVISATGDDSDAGPQTKPVEVTGTPLPSYTGDANDPAVGTVAPDLHGSAFDDTPVNIGNDGRAKVVMFVAHWCPHCRAEVPRIVSWLGASGMPHDVDLYAVSTGVSSDAPNYPPSKWLADADWPITTMADDADSSAADAFGLQSYPYFVAIGSDGRVVARGSGELSQDQFERLLQVAASGSTAAS